MTSVVLVLESTVDDMIAADLFGIFTLDQIAQLFFFRRHLMVSLDLARQSFETRYLPSLLKCALVRPP